VAVAIALSQRPLTSRSQQAGGRRFTFCVLMK
jgi:hypothetical protein